MTQAYRFVSIEDNLKFVKNGRRPQFFSNWKRTLKFWKLEMNLAYFVNGRQLSCFIFIFGI